jgi:hypothetical protein
VSGAGLTRFQAAYISPGEMALIGQRLQNGQHVWEDDSPQHAAHVALPPVDGRHPILGAVLDRFAHRAQAGVR